MSFPSLSADSLSSSTGFTEVGPGFLVGFFPSLITRCWGCLFIFPHCYLWVLGATRLSYLGLLRLGPEEVGWLVVLWVEGWQVLLAPLLLELPPVLPIVVELS